MVQEQDLVRANQPGVWYVRAPETQQTSTWQVGDRYVLEKVLGEGSFSCVCLATDLKLRRKVALKRVGDVLASTENAKRVLRECAILRRLNPPPEYPNPGIVALYDLFMHPSSTGRLVYRGGRLVPTSIDLYMALEYCDQGDLFHMRGQLAEFEVQAIMWQLFQTLRYMHACDVWHRDIKSANILISMEEGHRVAKLCDFGSARSAREAPGPSEPKRSSYSTLPRPPSSSGPAGSMLSPQQLQQADMYLSNEAAEAVDRQCSLDGSSPMVGQQSPMTAQPPPSMQEGTKGSAGGVREMMMTDLAARPASRGRAGFSQPMTRTVCTPCYRAPEVVMSHGLYSSALDMWSLGCVFGELLQRVPYPGKSATPHLQVAPVISVTGDLATPKDGDHYGGPGNQVVAQELAALFAVLGTPSWSTIDQVVKHPAWRAYLHHIPGRPCQLYRRFGAAGDAAVDMLSRLLEFDPTRRASAEEACEHAYFDSLKRQMELWELEELEERMIVEQQQAQQQQGQGQRMQTPPRGDDRQGGRAGSLQPCTPNPRLSRSGSVPPGMQPASAFNSPVSMDGAVLCQAARAGDVLAELEVKLSALCAASGPNNTQPLREMLERECEEIATTLVEMETALSGEGSDRASARMRAAGGSSNAVSDMELDTATPAPSLAGAAPLGSARGDGSAGGVLEGAAAGLAGFKSAGSGLRRNKTARRYWGPPHSRAGLKPDPGNSVDPIDIGKERLSHHRDSEQAGIEPEQHLRAGRHDEWVPTSLAEAQALKGDSMAWGVTVIPPGMQQDQLQPGMMEAIMKQHKR